MTPLNLTAVKAAARLSMVTQWELMRLIAVAEAALLACDGYPPTSELAEKNLAGPMNHLAEALKGIEP